MNADDPIPGSIDEAGRDIRKAWGEFVDAFAKALYLDSLLAGLAWLVDRCSRRR